MQPAVSVIIPAFNVASNLPECLESVCKQTLGDIEILVIDDGSTDNTYSVIRSWQTIDRRIRLLSQKNLGPGSARNRGIADAKGRYLFFLDADDCMADSNVLKLLYQNAIQKNIFVCGGSLEVKKGSKRSFHTDKEMHFLHEGLLRYRDWQYDYGYYRFLYLTDFVRKNNVFFPSLWRYQDPIFFVKILTLVDSFYVLPQTTYVWKWHKVNWNERKVVDLLDGILLVARFARDQGFHKLLWRQMVRLIVEYKQVVLRSIYSDARIAILSRILQCAEVFLSLREKVKNPYETLLNCFEITQFDILVAHELHKEKKVCV